VQVPKPLLWSLFVLTAACGDPNAPARRESLAVGPETGAAEFETRDVARESVDALRALGYIGFTEEKADPVKRGVVRIEPEVSWPGHNLVSNHRLASAELFTSTGELLRRWQLPNSRQWQRCRLLANGDLLVIGEDEAGTGRDRLDTRYLALLSFNGELRWKRQLPVHHDVDPYRPGTLLALSHVYRSLPDLHATVPSIDNHLVLITDDGIVMEEASLYDLLTSGPFPFRVEPVAVKGKGRNSKIDLFHANSVSWMPYPALRERGPLYDPGHVLVSIRHQDSVVLIDWTQRQLIWAWGRGELSGPHDATWLDNGNILIFDNGVERGWSRVVEVDPQSGEIVWQYPGEPGNFFTLRMGSSQRLPNGNTLIAESDLGHAFEVTTEGEIVWEFWSPHFNDEGKRATLARIRRYPSSQIAAMREAAGSDPHRPGARP
jgi:outer membrane protein assembly factor BamB